MFSSENSKTSVREGIAFPRKLFKIMKLTTWIILLACVTARAESYSQKVTISTRNAQLLKVFKEIEKQTGYLFFYENALLKKGKNVSLNVNNIGLEEVLKLCFEEQPFDYRIFNKTIVLKQREETPEDPVLNADKAPELEITGMVTNDNGGPLAGATVRILNSEKATSTDANGHFILKDIDLNTTLVVSFVGYESQEFTIKQPTRILVKLKLLVGVLDETVIVGYGTSSKRKNTGSVSSITSEDIAKQPVANPLNALQGRVSGAIVTQQNGLPGSRVTVLIRGQNSLSNGTQPLYIIDGVPFNTQDQSVPATNDLNSYGIFAANRGISPFSIINPADIERIDILKDADATAIYGTRAANGVVLITTKKGKAGKTKVDLNVYRGAGKVSRFVPMMDLKQYLQMRREAFANDGIVPTAANAPDLMVWDTTKSTNWLDKYLGGTANTIDAQATVSGGDERTRFLLNAGYHDETTVWPGSFGDSRISTRFNAEHNSLDRKFNVNLTSSYSVGKTNLLATDLSSAVFNLPPNMPLHKADGTLFWNANFTNPESHLLANYFGKTNSLLTNLQLRYTIIPGLDLKANVGFNKITIDQNQQNPVGSKNPLTTAQTSSARFAIIDQETYIIEPQATYTRKIGLGKLNALVGTTFQQSINEGLVNAGDNYSNPGLLSTISGAGLITTASATYTLYKYNSLFGRINYEWNSKYVLNVNFRRDGSSRFGADNRFGNFGSVGAAWFFTNEKMIGENLKFLSFGKLRASYGLTGSDQLQDYQYITLYNVSSGNSAYQGSSVLSPARISNPSLKWETNKKLELGLDLGFLRDRILLTANVYRNRSDNQLGFLRLGSQAGFNSYSGNFDALIQNSGTEIELNTSNIKHKNFEWKSSFNITIPRTKLLEASTQYFNYNQQLLGEPLSIAFRYQYAGINAATGLPQYVDQTTKQLTMTPNFNTDRLPEGFTAPNYYGGIDNTLRYKQFDFSFFFQFQNQAGTAVPGAFPGALFSGNQSTYWLNRWQSPNNVGNLPKASTTNAVYSSFGSSDATWGSLAFVRLRNVNLAYSLPRNVLSKLKLSQCRFYLQGQNLYTFTNAKYISDPETILNINQASVVMPPLRVITIGMNVSL